MPRKPSPQPERFTIEGNKGGSFLTITKTDREDVVHLELGHDCVIVCDQDINVWALAQILAWAFDLGSDQNDGFATALRDACPRGIPEWAKPYEKPPSGRVGLTAIV